MSISYMKSGAPAVRVSDLSFGYSQNEEVLRGINLTIPSGEFMAILGPNGGGKTTLLKLILGLLKPQSGSVEVYGLSPEKARQNIGYVPQFSTLNPRFPASVMEVVLSGAAQPSLFYGTKWSSSKKHKEQALELLDIVGLKDVSSSQVAALSGGQRQRVLVARALMGRPTDDKDPYLLVLDEPTANIDPQGKFCFFDFLNKIHSDLSIIVVSHDLALTTNIFTSFAFVNRDIKVFKDASEAPAFFESFFGHHDKNCPVHKIMNSLQN